MKRPRNLWLTAVGIAAGAATLGTGLAAVQQWYPSSWALASAGELRQVAQVAYDVAVAQAQYELLLVQSLLAQALADQDPVRIQFLRTRELEIEADLTWLKAQQAIISGQQ
mgnify:CR=1 FL=1